MDIFECHDLYKISMKKLRQMLSDGILKLESEKTARYWRQTILDIKKGKMSARSIALAYRFPEYLEKLVELSLRDRRVIASHFDAVEFPIADIDLKMTFAAPIGAIEKNPVLLNEFIQKIQQIIPEQDVSYYYVAARLMLYTCKTDFQINLMSERLSRAFASAKEESSMQGWWFAKTGNNNQDLTVYHRPKRYDL